MSKKTLCGHNIAEEVVLSYIDYVTILLNVCPVTKSVVYQ